MRSSHRKDKQHGSNTVEFAVSAIVFFGMLLGAIEFARLIYVWNTVQEVSRNAARQLVVTDFNDAVAIARIKRTAMFLPPDGTEQVLAVGSGTYAIQSPPRPTDEPVYVLTATVSASGASATTTILSATSC